MYLCLKVSPLVNSQQKFDSMMGGGAQDLEYMENTNEKTQAKPL